jgi:hypothetical protein
MITLCHEEKSGHLIVKNLHLCRECRQTSKDPERMAPPISTLSSKTRNILSVFKTCGILIDWELETTEAHDSTFILEQIHFRSWSSEDFTVASYRRAAITQQLDSCLLDIDFQGAIRWAKELDEHLKSTGSVVGPLNGLPISFKVSLVPVPLSLAGYYRSNRANAESYGRRGRENHTWAR